MSVIEAKWELLDAQIRVIRILQLEMKERMAAGRDTQSDLEVALFLQDRLALLTLEARQVEIEADGLGLEIDFSMLTGTKDDSEPSPVSEF
jgi:hypothetical protein